MFDHPYVTVFWKSLQYTQSSDNKSWKCPFLLSVRAKKKILLRLKKHPGISGKENKILSFSVFRPPGQLTIYCTVYTKDMQLTF